MSGQVVDLAFVRAQRARDLPTECRSGLFVTNEDLLRRMVQTLWQFLVFVDRDTAGEVLKEAGFSQLDVDRFGDWAFALLLIRRRVMLRSADQGRAL